MNLHSFQTALAAIRDGHRPAALPMDDLTGSAVLIPITADPEPEIIFTKRAAHLKHHPGQISFPGGRIEAGETAWRAALREAWEEIGLHETNVRYLGRIADAYSPKGFHIACFVGEIRPFKPKINHDEVDHLVTVRWNELFDDSRHRREPWKRRPEHMVDYFQFDEGLVWGVTGRILFNLRQTLVRLTAPPEESP